MTDPTTDQDEAAIRPFADWLRDQSKGATHEELSENLHTLIAAVRDTGRKGTLALTITVAPLKGDTDRLVVSDEIKLRVPEHDRSVSLFFPDKHGNLTRSDPNQLAFDSLREVPAGTHRDTDQIKEARR